MAEPSWITKYPRLRELFTAAEIPIAATEEDMEAAMITAQQALARDGARALDTPPQAEESR